MKQFNVVMMVLLIVGGLNWGLVGLFDFDLVATIFGNMSVVSRIVYALVGLAALMVAMGWKSMRGATVKTGK
jgi:uncharacterized membrane protein YuzA (DUF378 family)